MAIVTEELIERVAGQDSRKDAPKDARERHNHHKPLLEVRRYLDRVGIKFTEEDNPDGTVMYHLQTCPFNPDHGGNCTSILQPKGGNISFKCHHDRCIDYTIDDLFRKIGKPLEDEYEQEPFSPPDHWELLDAADARNWDCPDPEWFAKDIFVRGTVAYVAGDSQVGKSLLMVHAALKLARGERLFDTFEVNEAERILYLALEDPPRRIRKRLLDTDRTGNLVPARKLEFYVAPGLQLNDCLCRQWLAKFLEDGKYSVVFIDTFQKATPGVLSFDDRELSPILHFLADLARRLDILIVILDHLAKPKDARRRKEISITDIKGTGAKAQNADTVVLLDRVKPDQLAVQVACKDSDKRLHFLLQISPEGATEEAKFQYMCDLSEATSQAKEKAAARRQSILQAMIGKGWMSFAQVKAAAPPITDATLRRDVQELCSQGAVESNGKEGRWRLYRAILPNTATAKMSDSVNPAPSVISTAHSQLSLFQGEHNNSLPRTDNR